jgi:hypothetical protein
MISKVKITTNKEGQKTFHFLGNIYTEPDGTYKLVRVNEIHPILFKEGYHEWIICPLCGNGMPRKGLTADGKVQYQDIDNCPYCEVDYLPPIPIKDLFVESLKIKTLLQEDA